MRFSAKSAKAWILCNCRKDLGISKLIPRMTSQSRVIAKGNRIRDVQRFVDT
jgi:hypothetical protein